MTNHQWHRPAATFANLQGRRCSGWPGPVTRCLPCRAWAYWASIDEARINARMYAMRVACRAPLLLARPCAQVVVVDRADEPGRGTVEMIEKEGGVADLFVGDAPLGWP